MNKKKLSNLTKKDKKELFKITLKKIQEQQIEKGGISQTIRKKESSKTNLKI